MAMLGTVFGIAGTKIVEWFTGDDMTNDNNKLMDNQISIMELTGETLKNMSDNMNKNNKQLNDNIWMPLWLQNKLEAFDKKQKNILNMMLKNTMDINSETLPTEMLSQHVRIMVSKLKNDQRLLGNSMTSKIWNIYKLASVSQIIKLSDSIITIVKIPLVRDIFQCERIIAVPFHSENQTKKLAITYEYLFTNAEMQQYYLVGKEEKETCNETIEDHTICELNRVAIKMNKHGKHECEYELRKNNSNECNEITLHGKQHWENIKNNQWLYAANNSRAKITCKEREYSVTLNGSGILTLEPRCKLETEEIWINNVPTQTTDANAEKLNWNTFAPEGAKNSVSITELNNKIKQLRHQYRQSTVNKFMFGFGICIIIIIFFMFINEGHPTIKIVHPKSLIKI